MRVGHKESSRTQDEVMMPVKCEGPKVRGKGQGTGADRCEDCWQKFDLMP